MDDAGYTRKVRLPTVPVCSRTHSNDENLIISSSFGILVPFNRCFLSLSFAIIFFISTKFLDPDTIQDRDHRRRGWLENNNNTNLAGWMKHEEDVGNRTTMARTPPRTPRSWSWIQELEYVSTFAEGGLGCMCSPVRLFCLHFPCFSQTRMHAVCAAVL